MNKIILIIILGLPLTANAGWLSFLGDVTSISSAMSSGQQSVSHSDLKEINSYLWTRVQRNQKLDGYKFLVEALEKSNQAEKLDTVAQTYYINGEKEKAIELYETRVLPTARATCNSCLAVYKKMVGLKSDQPIPYQEIYERNKQRKIDKEQASQVEQGMSSIEYAIWGILIMLVLNFLMGAGVISFKSANKQNQADA